MSIKDEIKKVRDNVYEIPGTHDKKMRASGRFYIADEYIDELEEGAIEQIINVACLPGVQRYRIPWRSGFRHQLWCQADQVQPHNG